MNSQNLPSTERCEKQISEIVQIKATTDESNIVIHKNIISDSKLPFFISIISFTVLKYKQIEKRKQLDISFLLCDRDYVIWDRDVYQLKC